MVNSGPDSNGSGFYISFVECEWMNEKSVVFGVVCNEESMAVLFEVFLYSVCFIYKISKRPNPLVRALKKNTGGAAGFCCWEAKECCLHI